MAAGAKLDFPSLARVGGLPAFHTLKFRSLRESGAYTLQYLGINNSSASPWTFTGGGSHMGGVSGHPRRPTNRRPTFTNQIVPSDGFESKPLSPRL